MSDPKDIAWGVLDKTTGKWARWGQFGDVYSEDHYWRATVEPLCNLNVLTPPPGEIAGEPVPIGPMPVWQKPSELDTERSGTITVRYADGRAMSMEECMSFVVADQIAEFFRHNDFIELMLNMPVEGDLNNTSAIQGNGGNPSQPIGNAVPDSNNGDEVGETGSGSNRCSETHTTDDNDRQNGTEVNDD